MKNSLFFNSELSFVSSIRRISGKNFSTIILRSTILYLKLFMFKKPNRGWLWYYALNLKRFSKSSERSDIEEIVGLGKGVRSSSECCLCGKDISDSEKPVESVSIEEEMPTDPVDTVLQELFSKSCLDCASVRLKSM